MNLSFFSLKEKVDELVSHVLRSCINHGVQIPTWRLLQRYYSACFSTASSVVFLLLIELTNVAEAVFDLISTGSLATVPVAGTSPTCHCTGLAFSETSDLTHLLSSWSYHQHSMLVLQRLVWPSRTCCALPAFHDLYLLLL